jgi:hypothetical protein
MQDEVVSVLKNALEGHDVRFVPNTLATSLFAVAVASACVCVSAGEWSEFPCRCEEK